MTPKYQLLVVDDDPVVREAISRILTPEGYTVAEAEGGRQALQTLHRQAYDLVLLDIMMPEMDGMQVLGIIHKENPATPVIMISGYGTIERAVEAMRLGAVDFLPKPFTPEHLVNMVNKALENRRLSQENLYLKEDDAKERIAPPGLVGESEALREITRLVAKVAPSDTTVLITGESGTGKELVAREIHRQSKRGKAPFITVDCGILVENLLESELFGHVKGSFTGATATKFGRFELAHQGTLFFDEIGNINLSVQAKLLRALQEREVTKVGSHQTVKVDVRIIAATNQDLQVGIRNGTFREDLFYRLCVVPIQMPPLRERREDIPRLVTHFLEKYNQKRKKNVKGFSPRTMKFLTEYDWPGNVRELENIVERMVVLSAREIVEYEDLFSQGYSFGPPPEPDKNPKLSLEEVEKLHIHKVLSEQRGQLGHAAELLGIDRKTLRFKLRKYGIR